MNKGKKTIALAFLMIANAIILVHTVIPHHLHNCIPIAFVTSQYHHDNQPVGHCNDHNCNGNFEDCALTKIYVKFDNDRQKVQLHSFDFDLLPCVFILFSDYSTPPTADNVGLSFRQKPYLISYHTEYISQSLGLRAPPLADFYGYF